MPVQRHGVAYQIYTWYHKLAGSLTGEESGGGENSTNRHLLFIFYACSCPCQWIARQRGAAPGTKVLPIASNSCHLWLLLLCTTDQHGIFTGEKEQGVYSTDCMLLERVQSYPSSQLPVLPDSTLARLARCAGDVGVFEQHDINRSRILNVWRSRTCRSTIENDVFWALKKHELMSTHLPILVHILVSYQLNLVPRCCLSK